MDMDNARLLDMLVSLSFLIACGLLVNGKIKARSQTFADFFTRRRKILNVLLLVALLAIVAQHVLYPTDNR